jgi:hypothetical protein
VSGFTTRRLAALGAADPAARELADRLLALAVRGLPAMYREGAGEYAFTRYGAHHVRGASHRYAAMVALGARFLPEPDQSAALSGQSSDKLTGTLIDRLPGVSDLGDAAVTVWAAAEHRHPRLPEALARLATLDADRGPRPVVESSWVVSALAAARGQADVEEHLTRARNRLLGARHPDSPLFPHSTDREHGPWYRRHIGCFADQVYPIQALARLHASGPAAGRGADIEALAAADACAQRICELQGEAGQWWWHYDARTGALVEGYPVYSVHQHAMAPMALLDLAEAGGAEHGAAIRKGLRWMTDTPELAGQDTAMIQDTLGVTWRKVYRGDPRKAVRAVRGVTTSLSPGLRLDALDKVLTPNAVDKECRPYEFGWMFYAWLGALPGEAAS